VILGADDFVAIFDFEREVKAWFEKLFDVSVGKHQHDQLRSICSVIKSAEVQKCLLGWITDFRELKQGQIIVLFLIARRLGEVSIQLSANRQFP
jgi:hypothetical protein